MRNDLTELVFILDMSGSMFALTDDTIGGYNSLLEEQRKQQGDTLVTTVLFNSKYYMLHNRVPIQQVKPLTNEDYTPRSNTAMLDAVGSTIDYIGQQLSAMKEEDRPGSVIVTIITDGQENSSVEYTWDGIKKMITHQREKYNWLFTFVGANIDVMQVSDNLGIDKRLAKKYTASRQGTANVYKTMSDSMSVARGIRFNSAKQSSTEDIAEEIGSIMNNIKTDD